MQWWIMPQDAHDQTMSVDNDFVMGMDFSVLPSNVRIIQWREGQGEIELTEGPQLRSNFYDVTPYAPFFQQFMSLISGISLGQAKKIQTDLITLLYENKRQLPYHHAIAAGDFSWEATDAVVTAMSAATLPALLGGTSGSGSSLVGLINAQAAALAANINANVVTPGNNTLIAQINSLIVDIANMLITHSNDRIAQINSRIVTKGNNLMLYISGTMLGQMSEGIGANKINCRLQGSPVVGLAGDIVQYGDAFVNIDVYADSFNHIGSAFIPVSASPIAPGSGPGAATLQFTPIGQSTPVTVTVTEMSDIMSGIHARRTSLLTTKFNKTAAVNAMTAISNVIAYDVTAGW
jgi:hypothetical protein